MNDEQNNGWLDKVFIQGVLAMTILCQNIHLMKITITMAPLMVSDFKTAALFALLMAEFEADSFLRFGQGFFSLHWFCSIIVSEELLSCSFVK